MSRRADRMRSVNARKHTQDVVEKFFSLRNNVLFTDELSLSVDSGTVDGGVEILYKNYRSFLDRLNEGACDHASCGRKVERRELRSKDEAATITVTCEGCGVMLHKY